ncbi:Mitochondrial distribution and morphology protein 12 [Coelomomyces lativittatus]|nr:Mitochondrial distribution and morphology protein 12 [Coelomomyces lativittatus]KAJ1508835.1 Mitochondrial distribution and morphology protein 12 [Coelomomyces lativittatus]KAJ1512436.1 Mitochondrial distribution and morphology protein 12 [Coelomomyces lativittatus]
MSIRFDWTVIDAQVTQTIETFLNEKLATLEFSFVKNVHVSKLNLGPHSPEITLLDLHDPFEDFYPTTNAFEIETSPWDIQAQIHCYYKGPLTIDLHFTFQAEIHQGHIALPMHLHIDSIHIDTLLTVAWIHPNRLAWCFLDAEDEQGPLSLIKDIHIQTSLGDPQLPMLHNVSKVEEFIKTELQKFLSMECTWPKYHSILFRY